MKIEIGKEYPCQGEGIKALILGDLSHYNNRHVKLDDDFVFVGVALDENDSMIVTGRWDSHGRFHDDSYPSVYIKPLISAFGIGKWKPIRTDLYTECVVSAIQAAETSYPLIGYISDHQGRLFTERWTLNGRALKTPFSRDIDQHQ